MGTSSGRAIVPLEVSRKILKSLDKQEQSVSSFWCEKIDQISNRFICYNSHDQIIDWININ